MTLMTIAHWLVASARSSVEVGAATRKLTNDFSPHATLFFPTASLILSPQMRPLLLFFYLFARPQLPPLILSTRPVFVFVFGSPIILPLCATTVSLQLHLTQETLQSSVAYIYLKWPTDFC